MKLKTSICIALPPLFAPSRVRGLKPANSSLSSLSSKVRTFTGAWIETLIHEGSIFEKLFAPSRVRGLKLITNEHSEDQDVRTFTGAWIETLCALLNIATREFAPSRVRGLKHKRPKSGWLLLVRTFTGAWIETPLGFMLKLGLAVRTFTGAWIETSGTHLSSEPNAFAPSRVRGLKLKIHQYRITRKCSHLHGCVD